MHPADPQAPFPARTREGGESHPTVSFVMCANKDNPWLDEAIRSVLAQDDPDFEFLIAANACEDSLWVKLETYAAEDSRIRLYRTAIGQLAFNLNVLANESRSDYLVRMDADDVSLPGRLRCLRDALAKHATDILGSAVVLVDGAGQEIGRMDFPLTGDAIVAAMPKRTVFCHPAVAIRRAFLIDMRGYLGGLVSEDTDLWLRAHRAGARLQNLPDTLLQYRIHGEQSIMSRAGYAEVASHWLREFLIDPSLHNLRGIFFALAKYAFSTYLPGSRKYLSSKNRTQGSANG